MRGLSYGFYKNDMHCRSCSAVADALVNNLSTEWLIRLIRFFFRLEDILGDSSNVHCYSCVEIISLIM